MTQGEIEENFQSGRPNPFIRDYHKIGYQYNKPHHADKKSHKNLLIEENVGQLLRINSKQKFPTIKRTGPNRLT